MTFKDDKDGSEKSVRVPVGTSLLEAAHQSDIDLEGKHKVVLQLKGDLVLTFRI